MIMLSCFNIVYLFPQYVCSMQSPDRLIEVFPLFQDTDEMSLEQAAYTEGISRGGVPGGGRGRANNAAWAAGSGGGFRYGFCELW